MSVKKAKKAVLKKQTKTKKTIQSSQRNYNNSSRAEKSINTQSSIIKALVALLVERKGGDVQIEELAKRTGINQRTIFRFFKDKQTLHKAMDSYIMSYLQDGNEQLLQLNFVGFAKNAFELFDKHESLTMAYVLSPFGQEARSLFRKRLNQAMIAQICKEKKWKLTPERSKRLALVTSLVNAKIWYDIRNDFGFTGKDMGTTLDWALNTLLENS